MGFLRFGSLVPAVVLGCALLSACNDPGSGPIDDDDDDGSDVPEFQVLGLGNVQERYTGEVAVRDGWAYTTTWSQRLGNLGNAVKIWNVAGGSPALVDSLIVPTAGTTGDVQISANGQLLVVAGEFGGSLSLYNRANPAAPQLITRYTNPEIAPGVHTVKLGMVNGRHYAFLSINPGINRAKLVIVDITDPAFPERVYGEYMGNPYVHDVFVRDGILFTALWNDGLSIYDIGGGARGGSPSRPVLLGNVRTVGGSAHNVHWFHDQQTGNKSYAIVGEEVITGTGRSAGDIHVVDVSDMTAPREVAYFNVPTAGTHNFSVDEERGILYAAYYEAGVRALNIRGDLKTCTAEQRVGDRCNLSRMDREIGRGLSNGVPVKIWGVQIVGDVLYASDMINGLWKLNARQ